MADKICPSCGRPRPKRKYGGYCRRCATLAANINTKRRRGNLISDYDRAKRECVILEELLYGKPTDQIIAKIVAEEKADEKVRILTRRDT